MSFVEELKRRNVLRVGLAYVAVSWLLIQVADTIFPAYGLPASKLTILITILGIGFIPAVVLAWVFELTPEGLKKDSDVDRSASIAPATGKKLDRAIIVVLMFALGYFAVDKFVLDPTRDIELIEEATQQGRTQALVDSYGEKSIAVLPFVNMSSDPEQAYFSDGISEELLNLLAKIRELRVISRSSAFSYKGKDIDIPTVAKELNVAHVLEGSVRKSGNKIRITVQLIDARTDTHLWSETYDRTLDDVFVIQDEIAAEVVARLKIELLGSAPVAKKVNPQAFAFYLKARRILDDHNDNAHIIEAESLIEQALELDPDYIPALSELARVYIWGGGAKQLTKEEGKQLARDIVARIEAIDPDDGNSDAWLAWWAFYDDFDFVAGARHLQRALMLNPTDVEYLRDSVPMVMTLGYLDEAVAMAEYVVANDPLCTRCQYYLARAYRLAGRLDEAEAAIRAALILVDPGQYPLDRDLGRVLALKGDPQAALEAFEKAESLQGIAVAMHDLGRQAEFEATFSELHEKFGSEFPGEVAYVYAWIGDADAAFEWLDKEFRVNRVALSREVRYPVFSGLHDDPRWPALLQDLGMSPEQLAAIDFKVTLPQGSANTN
jgi:TolB-like protein/cytochrome c-type biogenesis protein CcmH/NrfG